MPKEISHIVIAQEVLAELKGSGYSLLARIIEENLPAFCLGTIIPDAFFYDVAPSLKISKSIVQVSRALHLKETGKNDKRAVGLFEAISLDPRAWHSKAAFAAGIVTHTVSDRIVHGVIDHYTTTWGHEGRLAIASHRQIETLIDMVLLQQSRQHPRDFGLKRRTAVDRPTQDCLFRFYLGHLIGDNSTLPVCLMKALKRAYAQQCLLLKLFTVGPLYHMMNLSNKLAASSLQAWSSLFYPDTVGTQTFPVLHKLDLNALTDGRSFTVTLATLMDEVITEAIRQIDVGVRMLATD
jgi:hypothetical protein